MNNQTEREQLEDVLSAYLEAVPNYALLNEWIQRYPYYEKEITDFTVAHTLLNTLPEQVVTAQDQDELRSFGQQVARSLFAQTFASAPEATQPVITSLLAVGSTIELTLHDIARHTRLSAALVRKLDRRLISFSSIPQEVVENMARALGQQIDSIRRYLQLPPTLAQGAHYRADQTPTLAEPEHFADAVRNDRSLHEEDRAYWLTRAHSE